MVPPQTFQTSPETTPKCIPCHTESAYVEPKSEREAPGGGASQRIPPHPKRRRQMPPPAEATTLAQLLREYALAAARLELLVAGRGLHSSTLQLNLSRI